MQKILLFSCMLLIPVFLMGQNDSAESRLSLGCAPLSLLNPYDAPCVEVCAEIKIYRNLAFASSCGSYLNVGPETKWWWKEHARGFVVRPELKIYLNRKGLANGRYFAFEYLCKKQDFDFWVKLKDTVTKTADYRIHKESNAFNLKYGQLITGKSRLMLEWFVGAGVCFVNGYDTLANDLRADADKGEGSGGLAGAYIRWADKHTQPYVTSGIRLSFRLI